MEPEFSSLPTQQLFSMYVAVLEALRSRRIIRSTNNPIADYAELLCERALLLRRAPKSTKGYDALDNHDRKYEIKGRRITSRNSSRQLSALRGLDEKHFTFLAGVLFHEDFSVMRGCLVPHKQVLDHSAYREHPNAWIFHLTDRVWELPGVVDITADLQRAERELQNPGLPP